MYVYIYIYTCIYIYIYIYIHTYCNHPNYLRDNNCYIPGRTTSRTWATRSASRASPSTGAGTSTARRARPGNRVLSSMTITTTITTIITITITTIVISNVNILYIICKGFPFIILDKGGPQLVQLAPHFVAAGRGDALSYQCYIVVYYIIVYYIIV